MNKTVKRIAVFLVFVMVFQAGNVPVAAAEMQYPINYEIVVNGENMGYVPAFDLNYENNLYVSLKGLAYALRETDRAFTPMIEKQKIEITTGICELEGVAVWDEEALRSVYRVSASRIEMLVDGEDRKYSAFTMLVGGEFDAFLMPVSLAMMFDFDVRITDGRIEIQTEVPFSISADELESSGYLQGVNALLIGDGTTGDIFYEYKMDEAFPIASTTKLMTYYVLMGAVSQGECSLEDTVVVSERVAKLSGGSDGVIPMRAGSKIPMRELLYGMLLPSSNESALAVAEHVAGSQEAFAERMNETAREKGWVNSIFYNPHGLPAFEDQLIPAKIHNHMTAWEMFGLASAIMEEYPQITEITSTKNYHSDTFGMDLKNTNAVLYNMENVVGLKTGTTNKAGACLVTCVPTVKDGKTHNLIIVLFGAEGDANRATVSEISARYAVKALREGIPGIAYLHGEEDVDTGIPEDPERVMRKLIRNLGL